MVERTMACTCTRMATVVICLTETEKGALYRRRLYAGGHAWMLSLTRNQIIKFIQVLRSIQDGMK